jgi:lipopolysaccharide export system protein LptA
MIVSTPSVSYQGLFRNEALIAIGFVLAFSAPAFAQKAGPMIPGGNSRAPVSIDAGKLDYFDKEQKLVYSGGVVATQGDATLKAPELVIFMAKEAAGAGGRNLGGSSPMGADGQVRRMEASGPVVITSKDQVGTGDRGVYDRAENKVFIYGNPVLSEGAHVVRGDAQSRLVYDLASGRAQVTGGRVQSLITPSQGQDGEKPKPKANRTIAPSPASR